MDNKIFLFLISLFLFLMIFNITVVEGKAQCIKTYQNVGILGKSEFGIGEKISFTVDVTKNVGDNSNIGVIARLLENNVEITGTRVNTITDSIGKAIINMDYSHPRSGQITIDVIVGDPNGKNFKTQKVISIKKTLVVKLNCPPPHFVNRKVICTWKTEDAETGAVIITQPKISVLQGIEPLDYYPTATSIEFTPTIISSINVKLTAEKEGYISGEETANIYPQQTTTSINFLLDNKDISTYSTGINKGTYQLSLSVDESGVPSNVQIISAKMRTPSSQEVNLIFNKQGNSWIATYNLEQAGQTYKLFGDVIFTDISKPNEPFEYSLTTSQSKTEDWWSLYMPYIIGGIIGLVLLIIFIVVIIVVRKRK